GGIDFEMQFVAHDGDDPGQETLIGLADDLEEKWARKGVGLFQQIESRQGASHKSHYWGLSPDVPGRRIGYGIQGARPAQLVGMAPFSRLNLKGGKGPPAKFM